ncbi:MAG: hypothetical protein AAF631_02925 [Pseudomonadota bacterium]
MTPSFFRGALAAATLACSAVFATNAHAQESSRFSWEIEVEIGIDSVIDSDVPANELTDAFLAADIILGYEITESVSIFAEFTLESVTGATDDRAFEDLGLYVSELGLAFDLGGAELLVGKISPAFGIAWDVAPGFYGANFAEDYELGEALGAAISFDVGPGTLTASVFYFDDTELSRSLGTDRGRNTTAAGGAGNTGKFNNIAVQYDIEAGNTTFSISASHLSAGVGDVKDQTGGALGFVYTVDDQFEIIGEVAAFSGFGGTADSANYLTLGAALFRGPFTYSAAYTRRNISSTGTDHIASVGLDYTFENDITLSSGLAYVDEGGVGSTNFGLSVIIPLGG